jgi:cytosine/adenosine deaminase-related metal-dependent hydrolase
MINAHNHLPMIAFRGLGEEGIENRLFAYFFPLEKEKLSRELIYTATIHGTIDMAFGGVTTYADMYYHMDEMAKATKEIGIRGILGETVIKFPVIDAPKPYGGLEYAENFIQKYKGDELITPAIAPHSPFTVSKEKLIAIKKMSDRYDVPILIHSGEFADEPTRIKDSNGKDSPIKYMEKIGFLSNKVLLAHSIHMTDEDIEIVKKEKVGISYNPMANAKGATGIARVEEMKKSGIRKIGLGTDGPMSSNQVDLFRVMSYASTVQRLKYNDRTIMTPKEVVELATIGGARALNMDDKIGSLEKGKKADIVIVETTSSNMIPNYNPYATLVFQANSNNVDTTIVNGEIIVKNRKLMTYDIEKDRKDMEKITKDIKKFADELAIKAKKM